MKVFFFITLFSLFACENSTEENRQIESYDLLSRSINSFSFGFLTVRYLGSSTTFLKQNFTVFEIKAENGIIKFTNDNETIYYVISSATLIEIDKGIGRLTLVYD